LSSSSITKADQIQENLIAYFRIFAGLPGTTFVEQDVTWFVNANGGEPGNHILRARLADDSADRRIDEIIGQVGQHTDQIDWLVFPGCQPADLGRRLEVRGMQASLGGIWMLAYLTAEPPSAPSVAATFHIRRVVDITTLKQWQQISAEGFGGDTQIFYDAYARHGFGPDACSLHYIGYLGDQPVTSATLLLAGGIASVYDVSTPPAWRRQGLGSAITAAALYEARRRGYQSAWIWSSQMGQSVYSKLGFVAGDVGVREYRWRRQ
jgi:GNAT superfamily N-acetyltransferase